MSGLGLGLGLGLGAHRKGGLLLETKAYLAAMPTQPPDAMKIAINTLIASLKVNGIWDKLDAIYLTAHTAEASLVNAKYPAITATNNNGVTFTEKKGWTGDTGKWLDLGVNLTTTTKYTAGKGTLYAFVTGAITAASRTQCLLGSAVDASSVANYIARASTSSGEVRTYCYDDALADAVNIGSSTELLGYVSVSRNATSTIEQYVNGARTTQTSTEYNANNVLNGNVFGCARNTNNSATPEIVQTTGAIGCFGIAGYLTGGSDVTIGGEHLLLQTALADYFGSIA